jgi:hypothetical protein
MSKVYNFCYLGGPSDGRTEQRHLSREEFFAFLDRTPKQGERKISLPSDEEPRYELTDFKGDAFYFEWLEPE